MFQILLVDDSIGDALTVLEACRSSPIQANLQVAYDGEQALKFLSDKNFKPDLILQDLNLPKLNGFALLERYRAANGPPVVVFSGSEDAADKKRSMELGARAYVVKPVGFHQFVRSIHGLVEQWSRKAAEASRPHAKLLTMRSPVPTKSPAKL